MNSKRITATVFAFAAAFSCIGAFNGTGVAMANAAEDFSWEIKEPETLTEGDFTYVQSGRFWNVQKYSGSDKNVVIPERVNGVTVQGIEAKAFSGNKTIESVEIPAGLYNVKGFDGCTSLKEIKFHDYETEKLMIVGENAFKDCVSLESVAFPFGTYYIENGAFAGCTSLRTVTFPEHYVDFGKLAFKNTPWLDSLPMDNNGYKLFRGTILSGFGYVTSIPRNAEKIGNAAFRGQSGLYEILVPANIKEIGDNAFVGCSDLKKIVIANPDCRIKSGLIASNGAPYINEDYDVFSYSSVFSGTICGYKGSDAEKYAKKHDIKFEELNALGDVNGDGKVDSVDASAILGKYAKNMTEEMHIVDAAEYAVEDVNNDGTIDSVDASSILSYYAYSASGGDKTIRDFLAK